ncbi:major facilitator superfamily transporter [Purpureocillium lavendulum]|uniref:Major facilitator superfamily transporter n=1 Tax=Purpureocillium lavendulum TaxID=1247861 RepID=A0AB34FVA4_9HYPO|nr:major facilitator superfamily transporter [Purpureocillium lavendulum]
MLSQSIEIPWQLLSRQVPTSPAATILSVACIVGVAILSHLLRNLFQPGLAGIPGPFAAKFTDLWRLYKVWQWRFKEDLPGLHEAHKSSLIRVGPKMISCSDPRAVEVIYGFHTDFKKANGYNTLDEESLTTKQSDMVKAMAPVYKGKKQPTMFAAADNKTHAQIRKPVAGAYAMTSIMQFEPFVDGNIRLFYQKIDELFIRTQQPCDIHNWVQYFAFDAVLEMTMSRNLGFMKAGGDVDGVLKQLQKDLDYRGIALAMPIIDRVWRLNPVSRFFKPKQSGHFAMRCKRILEDRIEQEKKAEARGTTYKPDSQRDRPHDFAHRFLEAQRKDPSISDGQLIGYMQANLIAGSDTTAVVMRTAIYYSLKQPWIHRRIIEELDAFNNGRGVTLPVPFRVARFELSFCGAVVREALRKHFAFIGMMERETPAGGVKLPDGRWLPGGVVIGMHGDLVGRDRDIFGDDADEFNPLRWLRAPEEPEHAYQTRLKIMNAHDLAFGHGPRGCIGKHVAEMEIYKFVPTFFALLQPQFVHPEAPWKLRQLFVFKQSGMDMQVAWRPGKSLDSLTAGPTLVA